MLHIFFQLFTEGFSILKKVRIKIKFSNYVRIVPRWYDITMVRRLQHQGHFSGLEAPPWPVLFGYLRGVEWKYLGSEIVNYMHTLHSKDLSWEHYISHSSNISLTLTCMSVVFNV